VDRLQGEALDALWRLWSIRRCRGCLSLGGVGRGKSFLMDSFYLCLPLVRKRRVHFHHFMRDVHRELEELKGREDPLSALAELIAKRYRLICFDEMHVNDIADAMIVGRLLGRIMDLGVVCCMTSNYHPDELYKDGLKRENFLPTIALLKERLDVLHVDGGVDYRQRMLEEVQVYHSPARGAGRARADGELQEDRRGRGGIPRARRRGANHSLPPPRRRRRLVRFRGHLRWGRSQHDYLDLSKRFHTV